MIKHTLEISRQPVHVAVRNEQLLLIEKNGERAQLASFPCEDVGLLLVDHHGTTYTHAALTTLLQYDGALIVCGRDHLPLGMLLPFADHTQIVSRLRAQLSAKRPLQKQLWTQVVRAKIHAQARNLLTGSATRSKLLQIARRVRSGDPENCEAQAARLYWPALFETLELGEGPFRRDIAKPGINGLLNYGYAVLRAAVARAIVAAGLLPALGLHHSHRSNAFCLADDLLEPLRPLVDDGVRGLAAEGNATVNPVSKRALLELLTIEMRTADQRGPLMVALHRYVASLVRCFEGESKTLTIPVRAESDGSR